MAMLVPLFPCPSRGHPGRRRWIAGLVATAALALTACGGPREAAPDASPRRPITHAMGTTVVPATPSRVVDLDTQELDAALSLGVVPVGATRTAVDERLPSYLQRKAPAADTQIVGTIQAPDLEAIARLRPDLILSSKLRHEEIYDKLSAIAPTVFAA